MSSEGDLPNPAELTPDGVKADDSNGLSDAGAATADASTADADVDATVTDSEPGPMPDPPPMCPDSRARTPVVEGPSGIMIQAHTATDLCLVERALDHICRAHRVSPTGRISDLVLTDVVRHDASYRPSEALNTEVLDLVLAYRHCYDNIFFGTIPEVIVADPYGTGILSETSRWQWLNAARRVADSLATYMDSEAPTAVWHWYVSYEANLNFFTNTAHRNAYEALLLQHVADLKARHATDAIFWSPTFWTDPGRLGSSARSSLQSALSGFFRRVPDVTWVAVQDHLGVDTSFSCSDALTYYGLVRAAAPHLASVQLNVEYFVLDSAGVRPGDPTELASRLRCYRDAGANLGASFDFRYWYETHGH